MMNLRLHYILAIALWLVTAATGLAQQRCQTLEMYKLAGVDKSKLPGGTAFERQLAQLTQNATLRTADDTSVYRIPVVFHVIHKGEPIGSGTNISNAVIQAQIRVLNEDYRRLTGTPGSNNDPRSDDAKIEFTLAGIAPGGAATTGINRFAGRGTPYGLGDNDAIKAVANWPPAQYLNIWICDLEGNYLGFSTFPELQGLGLTSNGAPYPEGIVIDYATLPGVSATGRYNAGRTATHEIGHYLGLVHVWGDMGSCLGDDFCNDTPIQQDAINGCPTNSTVCTGQPAPMVPNYLNYTDDRCMNIFTHDQIGRMRVVINHAENRGSLRTSPGLTNVLPPEVTRFRFNLYPNPSTGRFTIRDDSARNGQPTVVTITDVVGRQIYNQTLVEDLTGVNLGSLKPGLYFVQHNNGTDQGTLRLLME